MSGMHLLPVYYTTTSTKRRKKRNKTKSLLAAEKEHEKFLKKMGVGKYIPPSKLSDLKNPFHLWR